jgi:lipopolysaccharide export system protein LptC
MSRRSRPVDRFRLALIIAFLMVCALGSFWVHEVMRRSAPETAVPAKSGEPDYTVDNFVYVKMSREGRPRYSVSGTRLTHFPKDDTFEIARPVLDSRNNPDSPMTVRAQRALSDRDASQVRMLDGVVVDRPATAKAEQFQLTTEFLLVLPDDEVARTDRPVEMRLGRSTLTGVGAWLNNATREFRMAQQTHAVYQASTPARLR